MKEIARDIYLGQLIDSMGDGFIKVITGIRRCGKSYLLDPLPTMEIKKMDGLTTIVLVDYHRY